MARTQFTFTFPNAEPGAQVVLRGLHSSRATVYASADEGNPSGDDLLLDADHSITVWSSEPGLIAVTEDGRGVETTLEAHASDAVDGVVTKAAEDKPGLNFGGSSPFGGGASTPVGDWPVWLIWTQTPFVVPAGGVAQQALDLSASDTSWADYIADETGFAAGPSFPVRDGTLDTGGGFGFFLTQAIPAEALIEVAFTLAAIPGDPHTGGLGLVISGDFNSEIAWTPLSGTDNVAARGQNIRRRWVLAGNGNGVSYELINTSDIDVTVNRLSVAIAVSPDAAGNL